MNIVQVIPLNIRSDNVPLAGAETNVVILCRWLSEAGHRVRLLLLDETEARADPPEWLVNRLNETGADWSFLHGYNYKNPAAVLRLARRLRPAREWAVHFHLMSAEMAGPLAARLAGCRAVLVGWRNADPCWRRFRWRAAVRLGAPLVSRYVAVSRGVADYRCRWGGIPERKVSVAHHGLEPEAPPSAGWRDRLGIGGGVWVGFVGRLAEQKGLDTLLDAWQIVERENPTALLSLVGDGSLRGELQRKARVSGLERVSFHGHMKDASVIMSELDVLCLPSRWEGLGLVLLEAMRAGCPIVASRVGGIPEAVGEHGEAALLVPPDDPAKLAEALLAVCRDKALRERLGAGGRARFLKLFTKERHVQAMETVYREVLRENPMARSGGTRTQSGEA